MYEVIKPFKIGQAEYKKGDTVRLSYSLSQKFKSSIKLKADEKTDKKDN